MDKKPKIIIADDHVLVRKGLIQLFSMDNLLAEYDVDETETGEELLSRVRKNDYELIMLDISLPGMDGLDVLKELKSEGCKSPVLIISTHSEDQYAIRTLRAGAYGYIRKNKRPEELINAIKTILQGKKYIPPAITEKLLGLEDGKLPHEKLSDREYQVLCMLSSGKTQKEIADELHLSIKTVSAYRKRLLDKLELTTNKELTEYCYSHNLIKFN